MNALLSVEALQQSIGGRVILSDINFAIEPGEALGVVGPNGSGKTTLLNIISGHLRPSSGSIKVRGQEIGGTSPERISSLGVARSFQIPQLFREMTVEENLRLAVYASVAKPWLLVSRSLRNEATTVACEIAENLELTPYLPKPISVVPLGFRKLLDIAMALCTGPQLLLLDEPSSGIAQDRLTHFLDVLLNVIRSREVGVLVVEHDPDVLEAFTDKKIALPAR